VSSVEGMDALVARLHAIGEPAPILRAMQLGTVREARLLVHRTTGHLGRSIVPGAIHGDTATVEARTPYAATVELGSKPHVIRPRKAKVLAWGGTRRLSGTLARGSRATSFARIVHHPGTRPYPYLIPGARKAVGLIRDAFVKLWNEAA
jgi:hypothetical protein